ncbi:MAG: ferritin-like domain-containing protein [Candidatus Sumerlaeia bacterium]
MSLNSLRDLFVTELRDVYDAENRIVTLLPRCVEAASSSDLQEAFEDHLDETRDQIRRLDKIFNALGESPLGEKCDAMEGLVRECEAMINEPAESWARDALLISMAQRIDHYEIAVYGTVCNYAQHLNETEALEALHQTLTEEKETDKKLTKIAEGCLKQAGVKKESRRQ